MGEVIETKSCEKCGGLIHPKRLAAIPDATLCVKCQDEEGVPLLRRYDEYVGGEKDTEVVSTLYTSKDKALPYITSAKQRFNKFFGKAKVEPLDTAYLSVQVADIADISDEEEAA